MNDPTVLGNEKGVLLVVSGASGTGKGTVNRLLLRMYPEEFAFSVSATTRKPRNNEKDGEDYAFITREEFERKIRDGEMLEYTEYCGNYYGTPKSELDKLDGGKNLILELEIDGAKNVKSKIPDAVAVFVLPPDYETLKARLEGRGTNAPEDIRRRLDRALEEFRQTDCYDYFVVNPDGGAEKAAEAVRSIVNAHKHSSQRGREKFGLLFPETE